MTVGIFNTGNFTTDLAKKSFAGMITRFMPNGNAPLFGLTALLSTTTALATEHGFFTKTMVFPGFVLSASITNVQTVFTVDSTKNLLPGQIHQLFQTKENVIINTVLSPTSISVSRGVGTVAAAAITLGATSPDAYQVGNAYEEASVRPQALGINPIRITNLTQIFRNTWSVSGSADAVQVIAGDGTSAENRQDCAAFHAADIEKAIFFGQKSQGYRNGQPFRTMDGLISVVSNIAYYPPSYAAPNVFAAGSTTTIDQLEAMLDPVFDQATDPKIANERLLFVGGKARVVLNNIGKKSGIYQLMEGATEWGLQFTTMKLARGTFRIIEHPLFNSNPNWARYAVAVDLSTFNLAYLGNRKTQNNEFNQNKVAVDNGIDAVGGSLLTEVTTEIKNPPANAVITGLLAAA
ncbi:hypothetical protein D9M71_101940 [compost metagenome]